MKRVLLVLIFLLLSCKSRQSLTPARVNFSEGRYLPTLHNSGLRGAIKSVTSEQYRVEDDAKEYKVLVHVVQFNRDGYAVTTEEFTAGNAFQQPFKTEYSYAHDSVGRISSIKIMGDNKEVIESFVYDEIGNIIEKRVTKKPPAMSGMYSLEPAADSNIFHEVLTLGNNKVRKFYHYYLTSRGYPKEITTVDSVGFIKERNIYTYNKKGDVTLQETYRYKNTPENDTLIVGSVSRESSYTYDDHGNWTEVRHTKKIKRRKGVYEELSIGRRKIEYYE